MIFGCQIERETVREASKKDMPDSRRKGLMASFSIWIVCSCIYIGLA